MTTTSQPKSTKSRPAAGSTTGAPVPPKPGSIAITGAKQLHGSVTVGGSVRAALIMLAAAALNDRTVKLTRTPSGAHVEQMIAMLRQLGCEINQSEPGTIAVRGNAAADHTRAPTAPDLPRATARSDAAVHLIPVLLRAYGCAHMPWPTAGPIDDILAVYKEFGDTIETRSDGYTIHIHAAPSAGPTVEVAMPTRAATPTVAAVLRACVAGTRIVVHHPSRSPEAHALFTALKQRGWLGYFNDDRLDLDPGSTPLQTLTWTIPGDEFEAAACIAALAATRSAGTIDGVTTRNLTVLRIMLERAGARVEFKGDQVKVHRAWNAPRAGWEGLTASAGPEPRDLPSDQLALLFAITPGVHGRHLLTDQSASAHTGRIISPLKAFGAPIEAGHEPGQTILTGPFKFAAPRQPLKAPDAVSQATLLIAALAAQGTTVLASIGHLHHAHPALLGNLRELHADIEGGA